MGDYEFSALAESTLLFIADTIEAQDPQGRIDVDFHSDILNLTTKEGVFVINKHTAAKEIWLASPRSGPHHFSYVAGTWLSKGNVNLFNVLQAELEITFNIFNDYK